MFEIGDRINLNMDVICKNDADIGGDLSEYLNEFNNGSTVVTIEDIIYNYNTQGEIISYEISGWEIFEEEISSIEQEQLNLFEDLE